MSARWVILFALMSSILCADGQKLPTHSDWCTISGVNGKMPSNCAEDLIVDVPSVQEEHTVKDDMNWCNHCSSNDFGTISACTAMACPPHSHKEKFDTCADKSRILLTAEDGTKHCIKFGIGYR